MRVAFPKEFIRAWSDKPGIFAEDEAYGFMFNQVKKNEKSRLSFIILF